MEKSGFKQSCFGLKVLYLSLENQIFKYLLITFKTNQNSGRPKLMCKAWLRVGLSHIPPPPPIEQ